jgi:hypothetical protein
MTDPSKPYLDTNGLCPFRKRIGDPPHECTIKRNTYWDHSPGFNCSHGEWKSTAPSPCNPDNPNYNSHLWRSTNAGPMPTYNEKSKKWVETKIPPKRDSESAIVKGIMGMLPPIDYLGDKLYDLRKIDRLDEYDYNLPDDEERKKYFEEHREESERLLRKKKSSKAKPKRKVVKKVIKKCRCKK